jgi:hypothetical protein
VARAEQRARGARVPAARSRRPLLLERHPRRDDVPIPDRGPEHPGAGGRGAGADRGGTAARGSVGREARRSRSSRRRGAVAAARRPAARLRGRTVPERGAGPAPASRPFRSGR